MKIKELEEIFNNAKENKLGIAVEITIPGQNDTEYIVNKYKSLDNKLDYYKKAYGEDLVHCMNNQVRIVSAKVVNHLEIW